ncbi:MAG TPA: chemotaxis protein CheW [Pseudobacteroides sp.]|nr:chemotaxis protein CheW [Pseudobacteroides sp.]
MANQQIVIFKVDDEMFGINIEQVKEIITPMEIFKIPNSPSFVQGLINLRGKIYTILNLRKKFNLAAKESDEHTKIVLLNSESLAVGFIIDVVNEIIRIDDKDIESPPETIKALNKKYITGVAKIGEKAVLLLDLELASEITDESCQPAGLAVP